MNTYTCVIEPMQNVMPFGVRTIHVECDSPREIAAAIAGHLSEPGIDDPAFTSVELIAAFEGRHESLDASEINQREPHRFTNLAEF